MAEPKLEEWELWVLQVYFERYGFFSPHDIHDIKHRLILLHFADTDETLASLLRKKVLDVSPDGRKIRVTDLGAELYAATVRSQRDWEAKPIAQVATFDRDEVLIESGETFKANRLLREILSSARKELCILDPYVGPLLFDLLEEAAPRLPTRIVTSDKIKAAGLASYRAFRAQYSNAQLRVSDKAKLHDRFILWDQAHGVHLGHSIKDLGSKDTKVSTLKTPTVEWRLFEERWAEAKEIT